MSKVSIGLRGWRFEESEIFTEEGEFRSLSEIPDDTRQRLVRLTYLQGEPCMACHSVYGDEEKHRSKEATIVYGEPTSEVLLCGEHEADFLYWFREINNADTAGIDDVQMVFMQWFENGNRSPDGYGGLEHVVTDPDSLPSPPDADELTRRLNEEYDGKRKRIDLQTGEISWIDETADTTDDESDLDFSRDYPTT
ncbi:hypothetical protein [Haloquadratum walsbyi]|jgi:hypothetical protein|uniref:Uncharacterized protein n=1 Tax=Haloquadratum walsbyi J07HQW2 TaxID=1238425 RepID=U1PQP4_9EURY|nr:hypothetical protein [Haloquadratum walsbyi]ERG94656.1 MAG: hypothetical protein J07HQW2_01093 [Haloquadratum walsbyi J07HQW2]